MAKGFASQPERPLSRRTMQVAADYVLALKANHPTLYQQVKDWFKQAQANNFVDIEVSFDQRVEKGHHRLETRQVWSVPVSQLGSLYQQSDWTGLSSVVMVVRVHQLWNKTTREVQFYLSSLEADAQKLGRAIRAHWGIENELHWTEYVT